MRRCARSKNSHQFNFYFQMFFFFGRSLSWVARRRRLSRRSFAFTFLFFFFFFVIRFGSFLFSFIVHSNRAPLRTRSQTMDDGTRAKPPITFRTTITSVYARPPHLQLPNEYTVLYTENESCAKVYVK